MLMKVMVMMVSQAKQLPVLNIELSFIVTISSFFFFYLSLPPKYVDNKWTKWLNKNIDYFFLQIIIAI